MLSLLSNLDVGILAQVAVNADSALQKVAMSDSALRALAFDPSFAFQKAMYTWLLTGVVGLGVALIMKLLYLHIKRDRVKTADKLEKKD